MQQSIKLINSDATTGLKHIESDTIDTIITSPPYWGLRDYGTEGQIGLEPTLEEYHDNILEVTSECMRILKPSGVMFWNHGDSYSGSGGSGGDYNKGGLREGQPKVKGRNSSVSKCLNMQNSRLIIKMIDYQGWILRNNNIWYKNNGMPSSATDRFTNKHEPVYMLTKDEKYWFDLDSIRIPHETTPCIKKNANQGEYAGFLKDAVQYNRLGKNPGDVWNVNTVPTSYAHFATFPPKLIEPLIIAGCPKQICPKCGFIRVRYLDKKLPGNWKPARIGDTKWTSCDCNAGWIPGTVLDPFCGSGTTMKVSKKLGRSTVGIEISEEYCDIIKNELLFHQHTFGNIVNEFIKL